MATEIWFNTENKLFTEPFQRNGPRTSHDLLLDRRLAIHSDDARCKMTVCSSNTDSAMSASQHVRAQEVSRKHLS